MTAQLGTQKIRNLFVTGNPQADALLNESGTAVLIGMLLDQQVPMEWAFSGPHTIMQRIGHCDANKIAEMNEERFVSICCEKPAIHRFPASMSRRIHKMCGIIATQYGGEGSNLWAGLDNAEALRVRLRNLPGYGEEKTQIFIALLGKTFGIQPVGWKKAAGVFSDAKPRSIADIHSAESLLTVRGFKQRQRARDVDKQDRPRS